MPHVREDNGTPLQYSCLKNPMDGGVWWAAVHGVARSWTRLSDFAFTFHFHALEKEMATHSSVFAWRIPGTGEPGGLPSVGSHRVGHNWSDLAAAAACLMFYDMPCCMTVIKWWLSPPFSGKLSYLTLSLPASSKVYSGRSYSIFLKNLITFSTSCIIEWTWNLNIVFVFKLLQSIRFKNCATLHRCCYLKACKIDYQISKWLPTLPI